VHFVECHYAECWKTNTHSYFPERELQKGVPPDDDVGPVGPVVEQAPVHGVDVTSISQKLIHVTRRTSEKQNVLT